MTAPAQSECCQRCGQECGEARLCPECEWLLEEVNMINFALAGCEIPDPAQVGRKLFTDDEQDS